MADSDHELIAASKQGDMKAFSELVKRYEPRIATTVISMLGEGQEAEDVGQEVFIRFYKSMGKFKGESQLGTYLTRIAINLSINALKRQQRRKFLRFHSNEEEVVAIPDEHNSFEQQDTKSLVQAALKLLPLEFRTVIVLRLIEGYSTKETAEMLNLPLGTVLSRLTRAQKKLKSILEPQRL